MKKNNLFLFTIFIVALSLFSSCKKDNATLSISLSNPILSAKVYAGDTVEISGTAKTTGKFRIIEFVSNPLDGTAPFAVPEGSVTSCANQGGTVNFVVLITSLKKSTVLKATVIDMNGQLLSTDFTVIILKPNTTNAVTALTFTTATCGGDIADIGEAVLERGVCWSTTTKPTNTLTTKTSDGTTVGVFTSSITGLVPGQDYYVRAYSVTVKGILYGNEVTITTPAPEIKTLIPNGSFEFPDIVDFVKNPPSNVWSYTTYSGMQRNGSIFGAPAAPEGFQTGLLQMVSSITQTFTFEAERMALTFMAAQRGTNKQTIEVTIDDIVIGTILPTSSTWMRYTTNAIDVSAGTHTLTIKGTKNKGDHTAFIDDLKFVYKN